MMSEAELAELCSGDRGRSVEHKARLAVIIARDALGLVLCGACALLTVAWIWILVGS